MKDIAVILLASGQSRRFGTDKLLADLCGRPVLIYAAETAASLSFGGYFAVTGGSEERAKRLITAGFTTFTNPSPGDGQGSSLAIGASQVIAAGYKYALIMLADMPLVSAAHLQTLISRKTAGESVMSSAAGMLMPPAIFSGDALMSLTQIAGDRGAGRDAKASAIAVPIDAHSALDIDTPAELSKVASIMKRAKSYG